ncbi:hypothetical protein ACQJBY_065239 [Aegilops geniculata]
MTPWHVIVSIGLGDCLCCLRSLLPLLHTEPGSTSFRREELKQRDTQLKQTILELEHELEETKRKCSQLSTELQVRKSQQQLPYM